LLRYDHNKKPYWETLRAEITKRRKAIENRQLAEALAKDWREHGSPRWSGLAPRAQRKAFKQLPDLSGDAAAYVKASRWAHSIQMVGIVLPLILFVGMAAWLWKEGVTVKYAVSIVLAQSHLLQVSEPAMVEIPGGTFQQGGEMDQVTGNPLRKVTVNRFKIGKHEVTFEEYDQYVELTGGQLSSNERRVDKGLPVSNVSWKDAVAYAKWLSSATGKAYRLPAEAEWEYAARSGGKNEIWAGISEEKELKDYAVYDVMHTEPVGKRKPNGLGLYDMSGNVWEWVHNPRPTSAGLRGGSFKDRCEFAGLPFFDQQQVPADSKIGKANIFWPSGKVQEITGLEPDAYWIISEVDAKPRRVDLKP
jgi:formylglycine-generating enzyme required for sulfatase activity